MYTETVVILQEWARSFVPCFTFSFSVCQRRQWHPTPVFLPGESQGRGSLVGCRLWGRTESDTIEVTQQQQQFLYVPKLHLCACMLGFPGGASSKEPAYQCRETWVPSLGREDPLEKEMETHSSILAWGGPWTAEPDGLQSLGSQRVRPH